MLTICLEFGLVLGIDGPLLRGPLRMAHSPLVISLVAFFRGCMSNLLVPFVFRQALVAIASLVSCPFWQAMLTLATTTQCREVRLLAVRFAFGPVLLVGVPVLSGPFRATLAPLVVSLVAFFLLRRGALVAPLTRAAAVVTILSFGPCFWRKNALTATTWSFACLRQSISAPFSLIHEQSIQKERRESKRVMVTCY